MGTSAFRDAPDVTGVRSGVSTFASSSSESYAVVKSSPAATADTMPAPSKCASYVGFLMRKSWKALSLPQSPLRMWRKNRSNRARPGASATVPILQMTANTTMVSSDCAAGEARR